MSITQIGCEAYILKDKKLFLAKRSNVSGSGTWALPGGHLEFLERADECICRELKEELDLNIKPSQIELIAITDDLQQKENIHYVHITFRINIGNQEPKNLETDKCSGFDWFSLDKLPKSIFGPHQKILNTINSGKTYN